MLATLNGLGATEPLDGLSASWGLLWSANGLKYELPGVKVGTCTLLRRLCSSPSMLDVAGLEPYSVTLILLVPGPVLDPAPGVDGSVLTSLDFLGLRPARDADGPLVLSGKG